jgi:hypothetical protein
LSKWDGEDLHPQEQAIVNQALKNIRTVRLRDPQFNWWQKLPIIARNSPGTTMQLTAADD